MDEQIKETMTGQEEKAEQRFCILSEKDLAAYMEKSAEVGAKAAMKTFNEERRKDIHKRRDKRLRNTSLLLRNYQMLKAHAENSVFGRTQMEESASEILESMMDIYNDEIIIDSIKRSATRTAIIVSHIDVMLGLYEVYCDRSVNRDIEMRRYGILMKRYIKSDTMSVKEIAEYYNTSKDTVYSDLKIASERLSALIFGVDGLNVH